MMRARLQGAGRGPCCYGRQECNAMEGCSTIAGCRKGPACLQAPPLTMHGCPYRGKDRHDAQTPR
jgi:hypothetical protein